MPFFYVFAYIQLCKNIKIKNQKKLKHFYRRNRFSHFFGFSSLDERIGEHLKVALRFGELHSGNQPKLFKDLSFS